MMKTLKITILLLLLCWPLVPVHAQDGGGPDTGIVVTTQDYSSLRAGPGKNFERLAVIDPAVTMPAIGRTSDVRWVQVEYEGQRGWIYYALLVWVGDIVALPVDGVDPEPFVRRALVTGTTTRETPLYRREVTPSDQVGTLPPGTEVEVTARLGSRGFYHLQILYEGQLYWVGAWNIRITEGNDLRLLDTTYLYAYGRLIAQLAKDISNSANVLRSIEDKWLQLRDGNSVVCRIPSYARREASDSDILAEPVFVPLIAALDAGIDYTNAAISAFEDACGREEGAFFVTQQEVNTALDNVDKARQHLNIAQSLLDPYQSRDPVLGDKR